MAALAAGLAAQPLMTSRCLGRLAARVQSHPRQSRQNNKPWHTAALQRRVLHLAIPAVARTGAAELLPSEDIIVLDVTSERQPVDTTFARALEYLETSGLER